MATAPRQVLILCTGNSARSILAESLCNHLGKGAWLAHSAGSHPTGRVNPFALELLEREGLAVAGARSKSWDEFAVPGAPSLDLIVTVCDSAAGEACPLWPGRPLTAHWGVPDPAAVEGDVAARRAAFRDAYAVLRRRIEAFVALPWETLDAAARKARLDDIGRLP
jgi:arsenate reductase